MRKFLSISFSIILLLTAQLCLACQEAALNENFPIKEFNQYNTIVLVTVTEAQRNNESRYGGFLSFTATVQETIKGSVPTGSTITGQPAIESPRAVCPTHISVGSTYLLLLNKKGNIYSLSRFSFPTDSKNVYYSKYVQEVKSGVKDS